MKGRQARSYFYDLCYQVESERIRLNELPYFNPEAALRLITQQKMKRPTADDLLSFLKIVGYNVNLSDTKALVKVYDADKDGSLHTTEFHQLLISNTEHSFRERFCFRPQHQAAVGDPSTVGRGGETQIAKLLMTEIHGLRFLERDQGYMVAWRKINSVVAFGMLKQTEVNEVTIIDIAMFLKENGYPEHSREDLEGIFRRLDHNKDGRITYQDFSMAFDDEAADRLEMQPSHRSEVQEPSLCWGSPLRNNASNEKPKDPVSTPKYHQEALSDHKPLSLRSKQSTQRKTLVPQVLPKDTPKQIPDLPLQQQPIRTPAPSRPIDHTVQKPIVEQITPIRLNEEIKLDEVTRKLNLDASPKIVGTPSEEKKQTYQPPPPNKRQDTDFYPVGRLEQHLTLCEMLKKLLYYELANEKIKNELALLHDFNPEEAFHILDCTGRKELRSYDLIQAMQNEFGVSSFTIREVDLFMLRYDRIEGKRLRVGEFVETMTPREPVFAEYYIRRMGGKQLPMCKETRERFREALLFMIENEVKSELLRQSLVSSPYFSIKQAFCTFDISTDACDLNASTLSSRSGSVSKSSLHAFLRQNEFFATERELDFLFLVLDYDRDGRISYTDFYHSVSPRLSTTHPKEQLAM
ncbi:hypothetical protein FGO68_gene12012 [Halteria grandinella]|uniref:EF-hand domain-containing protein n=1 Tax=Halteria grandinella TaxID=5974 RepID=A0A8J8NV83_HALGN|nr:hypothetical protein FGO68_gene12012 [Halteria grandinella]